MPFSPASVRLGNILYDVLYCIDYRETEVIGHVRRLRITKRSTYIKNLSFNFSFVRFLLLSRKRNSYNNVV